MNVNATWFHFTVAIDLCRIRFTTLWNLSENNDAEINQFQCNKTMKCLPFKNELMRYLFNDFLKKKI